MNKKFIRAKKSEAVDKLLFSGVVHPDVPL